MGNWELQQEARRESKERDKTRREKLAGYLYDLSKITFTGLVIGGVAMFFSSSTENMEYVIYTVIAGVVLTYMFAWLGNRILNQV